MNRYCLFVLASLVMPLLLASGCATTRGYERADAATTGIERTRMELVNTQEQLELTSRSLANLVTEEGELRPRYNSFADNVDAFSSQVDELREQASQMRAATDGYFETWEQQIAEMESESIRDRATQRRQQAMGSADDMLAAYEDVEEQLADLTTQLNDLQRLLGADLTASGVGSASEAAADVGDDEQMAQEAIETAIVELNRVAGELSDVTTE